MKTTAAILALFATACAVEPIAPIEIPDAPIADAGEAPEDAGDPEDASFTFRTVHCFETPDCDTGDVCVEGLCEADERLLCDGGDCDIDCWWGQECPAGYECANVGHGDQCDEDADCPAEGCVNVVGQYGECSLSGRDCQTDIDCAPIPCIDSICVVGAICELAQ